MLRVTKRNDLDNLFYPFNDMGEFERKFFSPFSFFNTTGINEFKTDITDQGDFYLLETDLPGFKKEDIKLEIEGDRLVILAERHSEHEKKDNQDKYIRCERSYGSYRREFDISNTKTEDIQARYSDGVLRLNMPKKVNSVPQIRQLEIK